MTARREVRPGDRFARRNLPRKGYVVVDIVEKGGHPAHARLGMEGGTPGDAILIGVRALADVRLWRRLVRTAAG